MQRPGGRGGYPSGQERGDHPPCLRSWKIVYRRSSSGKCARSDEARWGGPPSADDGGGPLLIQSRGEGVGTPPGGRGGTPPSGKFTRGRLLFYQRCRSADLLSSPSSDTGFSYLKLPVPEWSTGSPEVFSKKKIRCMLCPAACSEYALHILQVFGYQNPERAYPFA